MTEIWKYFAYKEKGYWRVQELLPRSQINSILSALQWKNEVFASIQNYDENGNIVSGPLWFDLDGKPENVLADARAFVNILEFVVNVTPRIYFSGNKGFHLIVERVIEHPRVHELVADFLSETAPHLHTVDPKVYRTRSMFRIPGSPASKAGYYKIEITRDELFNLDTDSIRELATRQRFIETQHDPSKIDEETWDAWLEIAIGKLVQPNLTKIASMAQDVDEELTPCIVDMLTKAPPPGERNLTVFTLARFFRSCNIDQDSCHAILMKHSHFEQFEQEGREVTKVIRSVYNSRTDPKIGCRGTGETARLMRSWCSAPCAFRDDFNHRPFSDVKHDWTVK